jgi:hypothetical protein
LAVINFVANRTRLHAFWLSSAWEKAMDWLVRIIVGVGAAWIVPDPAPQQTQPTSYEIRCADERCPPR